MMKEFLIKLRWLATDQLGLDVMRFFKFVRSLPRFVAELIRFREGYSGRLVLMPCLHDRQEEGGGRKTNISGRICW